MSQSLDDAREYIVQKLEAIQADGDSEGIMSANLIAREIWKSWPDLNLADIEQVVREEVRRLEIKGIS